MKLNRSACVVLIATVLSACATQQFGTAFNQAAVANLVPGKTTKAQVAEMVGVMKTPQVLTLKKDFADKELPNPVIVEYSSYYFADNQAPSFASTMYASRGLNVYFVNSTLASYRYSSVFSADSTDFDESRISRIMKGSSEAEVIAVMGKPSSRAIYPFAKVADGSSMSYFIRGYDKSTRKVHSKTYTVYLDSKNVVMDFDLKIQDE